MNRAQAEKIVSETFRQAFDPDRFLAFIRNLVNHLDEGPDRKKVWRGQYIKKAFADRVDSYERIGTFTDPKKARVDVLVVYLRREKSLERARVTQRNFIADYLTEGHGNDKDAVLAAFVSPNEEDWRFSFVKLDYVRESGPDGKVKTRSELTPAKRMSFLVGPNENSHTAQKQFVPLLENIQRDPKLGEIEDAFKIEKVSKEFFEEYKRLFERTRDALEDIATKNKAIKAEFEGKGIECDDFAKKLLGQIVFLYFLQKKGWFGVARDKQWGEGNKKFLRELFERRVEFGSRFLSGNRPVNFYDDVLEPLFYEALALDDRTGQYYKNFDCRIPFLNGGLFEAFRGFNWVDRDILLPDHLFSNDEKNKAGDSGTGILDVFDRYNFTVNEAEPLDTDVAVDPEMLGKVFENLLPENIRHKGGTYYTPRVIVSYMCRRALSEYLAANCDVPPADIEQFVRSGERAADFEANPTLSHQDKTFPETIRKNAGKLDGLLESITVCDPAVGSGAFLVGMMQEIVRLRRALGAAANFSARDVYDMKRHAIQSSLHGVDLDPGAVEIAKLRLWLSLVVDEDDIKVIKPLPNLDFKIMQGNALLQEFAGISLINESTLEGAGDDIAKRKAEIDAQIAKLEKDAMALHKKGNEGKQIKRKYSQDIEKLKKSKRALDAPESSDKAGLFGVQQNTSEKLREMRRLHEQFFDEASKQKKQNLREKLEAIEWDFMETALMEQEERQKAAEVRLKAELVRFLDSFGGREKALTQRAVATKAERYERDIRSCVAERNRIAEARRELSNRRRDNRKNFFLWKLHFLEVFQSKEGFDVVIANPPYVRQEEIKDSKEALKKNYETFAGTADLLVYFYERAVRSLNPKGVTAFITSNKFFRAGYGENLRDFLTTNTQVCEIIDFGDAPVFDATAYAAVVILRKRKEPRPVVRVWSLPQDASFENFEQEFERNAFELDQAELKYSGWRIESKAVLRLLERIRKSGRSLNSFIDGKFYRGILTGLNEAFVVDRATRDRLIREHSLSADLLKPFLRGRDVKRWQVIPQDLWLIFTRQGTEIEKYPAILEHLAKFKTSLTPGGPGGRKPGRYKWFEIQDNVAYWEEFKVPKIVTPAIEQRTAYAFDPQGFFSNDKTSICVCKPEDTRFLLGVLNSSVLWWVIQKTASAKQGGFFEFKPMYVTPLPIPSCSLEQREMIALFVGYILAVQKNGISFSDGQMAVRFFEQVIDGLVYEILFADELKIAGCEFMRHLEIEKFPELGKDNSRNLKIAKEVFENLFDKNHPVRGSVYFLESVETVRIIEGKA